MLCLPGRGLGGSLHQTFVAGHAANAFALPLLLFFLSELRPALRRPGRWRRAAAMLALTLLSHFLMGLTGIAALAAYGVAGTRRRPLASIGRAVRIGLVAALLAAPLLVPFLAHWCDYFSRSLSPRRSVGGSVHTP